MQTRKVCGNVPKSKITIISDSRIAARRASAQNRMRTGQDSTCGGTICDETGGVDRAPVAPRRFPARTATGPGSGTLRETPAGSGRRKRPGAGWKSLDVSGEDGPRCQPARSGRRVQWSAVQLPLFRLNGVAITRQRTKNEQNADRKGSQRAEWQNQSTIDAQIAVRAPESARE